MKRVRYYAALGVLALAPIACGESSTPTTPSPPPTTTATVRAVVVSSTSPSTSTFQLTARADMSDNSSRDVTSLAKWETSNTNLATVSSTGVLTVLGSGQIEVRATYQNVTGALSLLVSGPSRPSTFAISGVAIETPPTSKVLSEVTVQITAGPDAGLTTTTDSGGLYRFAALKTGVMTIEARKDGYLLWRIMNLDLDRDRQVQIVMFPTPPKNTSGVDATARCGDSSWSWSTDRTAACTGNGGIAYTVCPGPLCELKQSPDVR